MCEKTIGSVVLCLDVEEVVDQVVQDIALGKRDNTNPETIEALARKQVHGDPHERGDEEVTHRLTLEAIEASAARIKEAGFDGTPIELGFHVALAYITGILAGMIADAPCEGGRGEAVAALDAVLTAGQEVSGQKFDALAARLAKRNLN